MVLGNFKDINPSNIIPFLHFFLQTTNKGMSNHNELKYYT